MPTSSRIMVIDDEAAIRALLEDALTDEGYRILGVANGREALASLPTWAPDLVILDLNMTDLDGAGFLATCRQDGHDGFRVLLLSARTDLNIRAKQLGVHDAVSKPFDLTHLLDTVEHVLAR
jgi:DNA-binding response OmpR family regulator